MEVVEGQEDHPLGRFLASRFITSMAFEVFVVYYVWYFVAEYNSIFLAGMVATAYLVTDLAIAFPGGHIIDRTNSSTVNSLSSFLVAGGFLVSFLGFGTSGIFAAVVIGSAGTTLKGDSFSAMIQRHVSRGATSRILSYNQTVTSTSGLVGIIMGGISIVILKDYLFYLLVLLPALSGILAVPIREEPFHSDKGIASETREVIAFMGKISSFLILGFIINGLFVSLTVYSSGIFHVYLGVGEGYYTAFVAGIPIGMIAGSAIASRKYMALSTPSAIAIMIMIFAPLLAMVGVSRSAYIDIVCALLIGLLLPLTNIPMIDKLYRIVPKKIFGKTFSILRIFIAGSTPIMASIFSVFALLFPINMVIIGSGLLMLPVSIFGFFAIPRLMRMKELEETSQNLPPA